MCFFYLQITDWGRDLPKKKIIITAHVPFRYPLALLLFLHSPSALYFSLVLSLSQITPAYCCCFSAKLRPVTSSVYIKANDVTGRSPGPTVSRERVLLMFFLQNKQTMTVREGSNDGFLFVCYFQKCGGKHIDEMCDEKIDFFSYQVLEITFPHFWCCCCLISLSVFIVCLVILLYM